MKRIGTLYLSGLTALIYLSGILIATMILTILVDVFCRVVGQPIPAISETYVEYAMVYATLLAAPWMVRNRSHVAVEALIGLLPPGPQRLLEKAIHLIAMIAALVVAWLSFTLFSSSLGSGRMDVRGVLVPLWVLHAPFAPCFVLVAIEFGRYVFTDATYYVGFDKGERL